MLNKARKISLWCTAVAIPLQINEGGCKKKNRIAGKLFPARVVCPNCKKRFKIRWSDCGDYGPRNKGEKGIAGCWHASIPPHKKTVKMPKKLSLKD